MDFIAVLAIMALVAAVLGLVRLCATLVPGS